MKKFLCLALCLVMSMTMFAGCGSEPAAAESKEVKIAFVGPQTGDFAEYGNMMKAGIQVAIDEWNAKGGVMGKTIVMDSFDDKNDSQEAGTIAEKIVSDDSYVAVVGHFSSGVAMTAAEIYQEAGIVLINGSAAHTDYSGIGDCIFRNNAMYTDDAASTMQILSYLGVTKFASFQPNSDAGVSMADCLDKYVTDYGADLGLERVANDLYEDGTVDFSASINKFNELGAEVICTSAPYSIAAPFIKQYKAINPDTQFILSAGCFSQEFLDLAGEEANGVFVPNSFFYESAKPVVQSFTAAFNKIYGGNPSTFAGQAYEGANMIFLAIENGQSVDRASIKDNVYKVTFDGVTGKIQFAENGDCPKQQTCLKVVDGNWTEIPDILLSPVDWIATMS